MLFATAVSDLSIADALAEPRYRLLFLRLAQEVLAAAPVARSRSTASTPTISTARSSASSSSTGARRRRTRASTATSRCASGRPSPHPRRISTGPSLRRTIELIHQIEAGRRICEVANLELLAAYARCEEWEPRLNAVITCCRPASGRRDGPLHGVAVAVKDNIDVARRRDDERLDRRACRRPPSATQPSSRGCERPAPSSSARRTCSSTRPEASTRRTG